MKYYLSDVTTNPKKGAVIGKTPKDTLVDARRIAYKKIYNRIYKTYDPKTATHPYWYAENRPMYFYAHVYDSSGKIVGSVVDARDERYHGKDGRDYIGWSIFWIKGTVKRNAEMWVLNKNGTLGDKVQ